jgi:hypothetical protein
MTETNVQYRIFARMASRIFGGINCFPYAPDPKSGFHVIRTSSAKGA